MRIFFGPGPKWRKAIISRIRDILTGSFGSGGFADNIRHLILVCLWVTVVGFKLLCGEGGFATDEHRLTQMGV
jgi:hypothetical protein